MRKITETIVDAFISRKPASQGNTHTDGKALFLHGNLIAWHGTHPTTTVEGIFLTLAGWNTMTTKERLRGVLRRMGQDLWLWTVKGQTRIGEAYRKPYLPMDPDAVVFVAHPCHARGLDAVTLVEAV